MPIISKEKKSSEQSSKVSILILLAAIEKALQQENNELALSFSKTLLGIDPTCALAHVVIALHYADSKQTSDKAFHHLNTAMSLMGGQQQNKFNKEVALILKQEILVMNLLLKVNEHFTSEEEQNFVSLCDKLLETVQKNVRTGELSSRDQQQLLRQLNGTLYSYKRYEQMLVVSEHLLKITQEKPDLLVDKGRVLLMIERRKCALEQAKSSEVKPVLTEAKKIFLKAYALDSRHVPALAMLAYTAFTEEETDKGERLMAKAVAYDVRNPILREMAKLFFLDQVLRRQYLERATFWLKHITKAYFDHHEMKEAEGLIQLMAEFISKDVEILEMRAEIHKSQKKYDEVIADCEAILRLDRNKAQAWFGLAESYKEKGNWDKALSCYEELFSLNHNEKNFEAAKGEIHYVRGMALYKEQKYREAIAHFEQATVSSAYKVQALWQMVESTEILKEDHLSIIALCDRLLASMSSANIPKSEKAHYREKALLVKGVQEKRLGRYQDSNTTLQKIDAPSPEVRMVMAGNYLELRMPESAYECVKRLLKDKHYENNIPLLFIKIGIFLEIGDYSSTDKILSILPKTLAQEELQQKRQTLIERLQAAKSVAKQQKADFSAIAGMLFKNYPMVPDEYRLLFDMGRMEREAFISYVQPFLEAQGWHTALVPSFKKGGFYVRVIKIEEEKQWRPEEIDALRIRMEEEHKRYHQTIVQPEKLSPNEPEKPAEKIEEVTEPRRIQHLAPLEESRQRNDRRYWIKEARNWAKVEVSAPAEEAGELPEKKETKVSEETLNEWVLLPEEALKQVARVYKKGAEEEERGKSAAKPKTIQLPAYKPYPRVPLKTFLDDTAIPKVWQAKAAPVKKEHTAFKKEQAPSSPAKTLKAESPSFVPEPLTLVKRALQRGRSDQALNAFLALSPDSMSELLGFIVQRGFAQTPVVSVFQKLHRHWQQHQRGISPTFEQKALLEKDIAANIATLRRVMDEYTAVAIPSQTVPSIPRC